MVINPFGITSSLVGKNTLELAPLKPRGNCHKAKGPDGIPACVLKELTFDLAPTLTHLYQQSLIKYITQRMEISLHYACL